MNLICCPSYNSFVFAFHYFWKMFDYLSQINKSPSWRLFNESEVGQLIKYLFDFAIMQGIPFSIVDCLNTQLVKTMSIVLLPPDSILLSVVPVQMPIRDVFRQIICIRLGDGRQNSSGGEPRIFDEVGSGLS